LNVPAHQSCFFIVQGSKKNQTQDVQKILSDQAESSLPPLSARARVSLEFMDASQGTGEIAGLERHHTTRALKIEQTRLLYAGLPTMIGVNLALALILVYVQRSVIDSAWLFDWLILMGLVSVYTTTLLMLWYDNEAGDACVLLPWGYHFRVGVIASGVIWGMGSIFLFPVESIPHQVFLFFVLAGLSAVAVTSLSMDRLSVLSFLLLTLMPLIVRFGMEGNEISLSLSALIALFLIVVSQNASRMGRTLQENIRLRIEAEVCGQMLRHREDYLKHLNQNLEQRIAGRTAALSESEACFQFLFEQMAVGVAQIDTATGRFMRVNQKYGRITGYTPAEILSFDFQSISHAGDLEIDLGNMERLKAGEIREFEMEKRFFRKDGRAIWVRLTVSPMWVPGARPDHHIAVIQDITAHKQAQEQIHQLAFHDPLTGLPNRRLFLDRLQQVQIHSARQKIHCAILFIDLDYFKTLNDTQGHDIGDLLLIEVARRLQDNLRSGDTVARLGGDEFVVILEGLSEDALQAAAQTRDIGEKILASLNRPFRLGEFEYHTSSSIGIRLFHDNHAGMDDLLKHADTAMYQAKTAGRNTLRFFDPSVQAALESAPPRPRNCARQ
jgi:diguanylate cyclase (GGDEF)-like protein/PAS domain S-box-containing protein